MGTLKYLQHTRVLEFYSVFISGLLFNAATLLLSDSSHSDVKSVVLN